VYSDNTAKCIIQLAALTRNKAIVRQKKREPNVDFHKGGRLIRMANFLTALLHKHKSKHKSFQTS